MKNILIHGLGQDEKAWNKVIEELNDDSVGCPNLFSLVKSEDMNYKKLYEAFSSYCNNKEKKLNLCGLSLGGILAIDYAKQYPNLIEAHIATKNMGATENIWRAYCSVKTKYVTITETDDYWCNDNRLQKQISLAFKSLSK